jgi:hypothetical protein
MVVPTKTKNKKLYVYGQFKRLLSLPLVQTWKMTSVAAIDVVINVISFDGESPMTYNIY